MKRYLCFWLIIVVCGTVFSALAGNEDKGNNGGRTSGLVAHYYSDAELWGGVWPDKVPVPKADPGAHTFSEYRFTRVEPLVNHRFLNRGWFSVRWQGAISTAPGHQKNAQPAGKDETSDEAAYTFHIWADDGCRLQINGQMLINDWRPCSEDSPQAWRSATVKLAPGTHPIVVEYFQGQMLKKGDQDPMKLYWECQDLNIPKQIVPAAYFSHTEEDLKPLPGKRQGK